MKKLPECPKCGQELRVVKSWGNVMLKKQRMECANGHRITAETETTFNKRSLRRLMQDVHA